MNTIRVLSRKFPYRTYNEIINIVDYQNKLSLAVGSYKGFIKSESFWLKGGLYSGLETKPIYNISQWKSESDWNNWFHSQERQNIVDMYKSAIEKQDYEILTQRHLYCDIPLL